MEAQTETVWEQADKYEVPRIVFVNKLDRDGASLDHATKMIEQRLLNCPLVIHLPVGEESNFSSIVDLVSMELIQWQDKDGNDRYTTEVVARTMKMLGSRDGGNSYNMPSAADAPPQVAKTSPAQPNTMNTSAPAPAEKIADAPDDDLPF